MCCSRSKSLCRAPGTHGCGASGAQWHRVCVLISLVKYALKEAGARGWGYSCSHVWTTVLQFKGGAGLSGREGPCPGRLPTWTVKARGSFRGKQLAEPATGPAQGTEANGKPTLTSAGMLATAGAIPFSVLTFPELLLGELGAEPGALLHAESVGWRDRCELCSMPGSQATQRSPTASLLTGRNHIGKEHDHSPQTGAARWIPYFWFCCGLPCELYTDSSVGATSEPLGCAHYQLSSS